MLTDGFLCRAPYFFYARRSSAGRLYSKRVADWIVEQVETGRERPVHYRLPNADRNFHEVGYYVQGSTEYDQKGRCLIGSFMTRIPALDALTNSQKVEIIDNWDPVSMDITLGIFPSFDRHNPPDLLLPEHIDGLGEFIARRF